MLDQARDVVGHEARVDRPVDVGRPAVPLQVGEDELVAPGQGGQGRPEQLTRPEAAVQQDQRSTCAMDLVVHVQAIDVGVLADDLGITAPVGRGHLATPSCPDRRDDRVPHGESSHGRAGPASHLESVRAPAPASASAFARKRELEERSGTHHW